MESIWQYQASGWIERKKRSYSGYNFNCLSCYCISNYTTSQNLKRNQSHKTIGSVLGAIFKSLICILKLPLVSSRVCISLVSKFHAIYLLIDSRKLYCEQQEGIYSPLSLPKLYIFSGKKSYLLIFSCGMLNYLQSVSGSSYLVPLQL